VAGPTLGDVPPVVLNSHANYAASMAISPRHHRFKLDFLGVGNNGKGNEHQATLDTQGHTYSFPVDTSWYVDIGATDHLTSELARLHSQEPYHGIDRVHTADWSGMRISHIGQASLPTYTSRNLHLCNVLCVPSVTRNLLSIKKFTRDNNVSVEFHLFDVFVKGRATKEVLLRGHCHHGLYALDAPTVSQVFVGVRVSSSLWHSSLDHKLPIVYSNKDVTVYDACQQGKSHQLPFVSSSQVIKDIHKRYTKLHNIFCI
jgi:hypothetical protein